MSFPMVHLDNHLKLPNLPPICKCCGLFTDRSYFTPLQEQIMLSVLFTQRIPNWTLRIKPITRNELVKLIYPGDNRKTHIKSSLSSLITQMSPRLADTGWIITSGTYIARFHPKTEMTLPRVA